MGIMSMEAAAADSSGGEASMDLPVPRVVERKIDHELYREALDAGLSPISARIYAGRGRISQIAETGVKRDLVSVQMLKPKVQDLTPPDAMPDIYTCAKRISQAIDAGTVIAIETDHDVDGVTSHAVLMEGLTRLIGVPREQVCSFIGHRLKEGYGLSESVALRILGHASKPALVITADNGSADHDRITLLRSKGVETVVTDHHTIPPDRGIPKDAVGVINPTRKDCSFEDPLIAGCMVAWYLVVAIMQVRGLKTGPAMSLLDFVALGTVADCVSMSRSVNNRFVVRYGLHLMNKMSRPCWRQARVGLNNMEGLFDEGALGFQVGPRINARGRLDEAMAGVRFLLSESDPQAMELWLLLQKENESRKQIERNLNEKAEALALQQAAEGREGLALFLESGHPGVHGIVASRMVERFGRPVVCLSPVFGKETTHITGSARQVPGFAVDKAFKFMAEQSPKLFEKAGGHEGAGGLTILRERLDEVARLWDLAVKAQRAEKGFGLGPVIYSDGEWSNPNLGELSALMQGLAPFGREFEKPCFTGEFTVSSLRWVGPDSQHLSLELRCQGGDRVKGIFFNVPANQKPLLLMGRSLSVCYEPEMNVFRGVSRLQINIKSVA